MKFARPLILSLTLVALLGYSAESRCEGPAGSTRVEACRLHQQSEQMKASVEVMYQRVQTAYKAADSQDASAEIATMRQAWLNYRDAVCAYEQVANGGAHQISLLRCNVRMLDEHLNYLQEILANLGASG